MTKGATNPEQGLAEEAIGPAARQRIFALLHEELARVVAEAPARGVSAELLAKQLDERISLLRRQIADQD
jgi:hypothetical protein